MKPGRGSHPGFVLPSDPRSRFEKLPATWRPKGPSVCRNATQAADVTQRIAATQQRKLLGSGLGVIVTAQIDRLVDRRIDSIAGFGIINQRVYGMEYGYQQG